MFSRHRDALVYCFDIETDGDCVASAARGQASPRAPGMTTPETSTAASGRFRADARHRAAHARPQRVSLRNLSIAN
jgi:hypothetical protein